MSLILFADNATTTLASSIGPSATVATLASSASFPSPGAGEYFIGTFVDASTGLINEIVWVTGVSGNDITMVRGREGTTAKSWTANDLFSNFVTAGALDEFVQNSEAQAQAPNYAVDTGVANAYVCALNPPITAPISGMPIRMLAIHTNTGASTVNPGSGVSPLVRFDGSACIGGEVRIGEAIDYTWNPTYSAYQIISGPAPATAAAITAGSDAGSFITPAQLAASLGTAKLFSGQCQLQFVGATSIKLAPYNGGLVSVNGGLYQLPGAGVSAANTGVRVGGVNGQNLAANTTYLVGLNSSGVIEFWTGATGHNADTTSGNVGVEVITGHADVSLIGMIRTNGSSQFVDQNGSLFVLSWFNRSEKISKTNFSGGDPTATTTVIELSTTIRNSFLVWAGKAVDFSSTGTMSTTNSSQWCMSGIGFDGATPELESSIFSSKSSGSEGNAIYGNANFFGRKTGLAEGLHYATLLGVTSSSTGTWTSGTTPMASGALPPCTLDISVMG